MAKLHFLKLHFFKIHGEYQTLSDRNDNQNEIEKMQFFEIMPKGFKVQEFPPRFVKKSWQQPLTVDINKLDFEMLRELIGLDSEVQSDLLSLSLKTIKERFKGEVLTASRLLDFIEITGEKYSLRKAAMTVKRKLSILCELGIFGPGINPENLVQKGQLTVIDLSGDVEEKLKRALCATVLNDLFEVRKQDKVSAFFVIVEESHRFCPQDEECVSKEVIRRLAREGRKFGVGICLTSQRVIGLDKDARRASLQRYNDIVQIDGQISYNIVLSMEITRESGIMYEFRTTLVPV